MRMFFSGLMESLKENKITFLWVLLFFLVGIVLGSLSIYTDKIKINILLLKILNIK